MTITQMKENKRQYLNLLLLGDEQESMIDQYLDKGVLYVLDDNGVKAVCVVTDEGEGVLEIKNIAVLPEYRHKGYGRAMLRFIEDKYRTEYTVLQAGTGDSLLTVPFYEKCGFQKSHIIQNFFLKHYDHPIIEAGKQLTDMVYFRKNI